MLLPENIRQSITLDNLEKVATITAVIIGGLWAYFNYFRGRTYKPRLELKVTGNLIRRDETNYLLAVAQLSNVGLSKIKIKQEGTALLVSLYQNFDTVTKVLSVDYDHLAAFPVFEYHLWVEPGEQIEEQQLIVLPDLERPILRVELRIVCQRSLFRNIEWKSWSVVQQLAASEVEEVTFQKVTKGLSGEAGIRTVKKVGTP